VKEEWPFLKGANDMKIALSGRQIKPVKTKAGEFFYGWINGWHGAFLHASTVDEDKRDFAVALHRSAPDYGQGPGLLELRNSERDFGLVFDDAVFELRLDNLWEYNNEATTPGFVYFAAGKPALAIWTAEKRPRLVEIETGKLLVNPQLGPMMYRSWQVIRGERADKEILAEFPFPGGHP
jgi:hypothetical protein